MDKILHNHHTTAVMMVNVFLGMTWLISTLLFGVCFFRFCEFLNLELIFVLNLLVYIFFLIFCISIIFFHLVVQWYFTCVKYSLYQETKKQETGDLNCLVWKKSRLIFNNLIIIHSLYWNRNLRYLNDSVQKGKRKNIFKLIRTNNFQGRTENRTFAIP